MSAVPAGNKALIIGIVLLAGMATARAAPFCVVVQGLPDECVYVDAAECSSRAARLHGRCGLNPAAPAPLREGHEAYCLVQSSVALSCLYADIAACEHDGNRSNGACVEAPKAMPGATDPFQQIRPFGAP